MWDTSIEAWSEFARRVSGEWDGFAADFSTEGKAIELPESVVPETYREWEVKVFDWQTQCPTLAEPKERVLQYKSIQLLPTVGCEADAATQYSVDERKVGEGISGLNAFAYQSSGSYVAVWQKKEDLLELECCMINPQDCESRVRIIQFIHVLNNTEMVLQGIRVFREQWYGPFRNGDQLGGCAIRDSAFASTAPMIASDVAGIWKGSAAVATFGTRNTVSARISFITLLQSGFSLFIGFIGMIFLFNYRGSFKSFLMRKYRTLLEMETAMYCFLSSCGVHLNKTRKVKHLVKWDGFWIMDRQSHQAAYSQALQSHRQVKSFGKCFLF